MINKFNAPTVYIVHCVDTEGPLFESLDATFERLKTICGLEIEATAENLRKIQLKELDLNGQELSAWNLVNGHRVNTHGNWNDINSMLKRIMSKEFRLAYCDSHNQPWIYNWFVMDHHGFIGDNPRKRDIKDHAVYDNYHKITSEYGEKDFIGWHYHPLPINGHYNCSGNTFLNSSNITTILAKKIIDRQWFPSAFRPGFHTERPDLNWFLEQWIPFDFGNQSLVTQDGDICIHDDLSGSRFGDWRKAPTKWQPYHPDLRDYQSEGTLRRSIFRCLNMQARLRQIGISDVKQAFEEASKYGYSVLSFTDHDFRDMADDIKRLNEMIKEVSKKYKVVNYRHSNALQAARAILKLTKIDPKTSANIKIVGDDMHRLIAKSNCDLFGPQPFLAIKTNNGEYIWKNFDFDSENQWSFTFDQQDLLLKDCIKIGVAFTYETGEVVVMVHDVASKSWTKNDLN